MKTTILSFCLFLAFAIVLVKSEETRLHEEKYYVDKFQEFKTQYHKNYADAEEEKKRLEIFSDNLDKIETHNARKYVSFKMGVNKFTDLSKDEFKKNHMGYLNKDKPTVSGAN